MADWATYEEATSNIAAKLVHDYQPELITLYGSCARGDVHMDSDIDMLLIKDTDKERHIDRWLEVRRLTRDATRNISFEPIVLRPAELQERVKMGNPFIREILEEGKVLYER